MNQTIAPSAPFLLLDLGRCDYETVHERQWDLVEKRKREKALDHLIMVEHPDVYTYGRKIDREKTHLTGYPNEPGVLVERGGGVTFHNPGQLVCYPVLLLKEGERDVHLFLRKIENTLMGVLCDFGICGERKMGATGVWVQNQTRKIASIGVALSGWVTYHGSALNVKNDLSGFKRINPCGLSPNVMTSMELELRGELPTMEEVKRSFLNHFSLHFQRWLMV